MATPPPRGDTRTGAPFETPGRAKTAVDRLRTPGGTMGRTPPGTQRKRTRQSHLSHLSEEQERPSPARSLGRAATVSNLRSPATDDFHSVRSGGGSMSPGGNSANGHGGRGPSVAWMPDAQAKACLGCGRRFSFTVRKHHCRVCGRIFCNPCSSSRLSLPTGSIVRACEPCYVNWGRTVFKQQQREKGRAGRDDRTKRQAGSTAAGGRDRGNNGTDGGGGGGAAARAGTSDVPLTRTDTSLEHRRARASSENDAEGLSGSVEPAGAGALAPGGALRGSNGAGGAAAAASASSGGMQATRRQETPQRQRGPLASPAPSRGSTGDGNDHHEHRQQRRTHRASKLAGATRFARHALPTLQSTAPMLPGLIEWRPTYVYKSGLIATAWLALVAQLWAVLLALHVWLLVAIGLHRARQFTPAYHTRSFRAEVAHSEFHVTPRRHGTHDEAAIMAAAPSAQRHGIKKLYRRLTAVSDVLDWLHLVVSWHEPQLTQTVSAIAVASAVATVLLPTWVVLTSATLTALLKSSALVRIVKRREAARIAAHPEAHPVDR